MKLLLCSFLALLLLAADGQKVLSKIASLGKAGRAKISMNKIDNSLKLVNANDEVSEYKLSIGKSLTVRLFQYGGDKADEIQVNKFKFTVSEKSTPLTNKDFNPRFLSSNMMEAYSIALGSQKFLVLIAKSAGAAGKAINYCLYQVFDITDGQKIKYYPATSYYGDIRNLVDLDGDSKLDFFKVVEKKAGTCEITAFDLFSGKQKKINGNWSLLVS